MKHIFISHAGADEVIASKIAGDLRNAGHESKVDTQELILGDDLIDFINDAILNAYAIVILYSRNTGGAIWQQLEIRSALWNELAQYGATCIVIRLDSTPLPPVLGSKLFASLNINDPQSYRTILNEICSKLLPDKTASSVLSDAFRADSANPFRRVRAEYFEDRPDLLAKTFAPPDALKAAALEDIKPCILEGSRGTGKSMLLLSLRARNLLSRDRFTHTTLVPAFFGFYLKLTRGAICNAGFQPGMSFESAINDAKNAAVLTDIASQEIIVCLLESMFSELIFCTVNSLLPSQDKRAEAEVAGVVSRIFFPGLDKEVNSFEDLLEHLASAHQQISVFIRRRFIYGEMPEVPVATFDLESFKRTIHFVKKVILPLENAMFIVLLDEYENLFTYQQRVVNGFIKLAAPDFTVKVAKKIGSTDTSGTTSGQELQETHDYTRVPLVYDVEDRDQLPAYNDLLVEIVNKILSSEGLGPIEINELLPSDTTPEVESNQFLEEVARLSKVSRAEFETWSEARQRERQMYYGEAAIYRVLYGKKGWQKDKRFSGFAELAFISSGVIRYFQEILGVAYHLTYGTRPPPSLNLLLPARHQSHAVHVVSQHSITTLSRNVETYGEGLKYFLLDLGDCLRHKLLKHNSEPESARLTIKDPEFLEQKEIEPLRTLLLIGAREGVFQTKEGRPAFKPKHGSDPQPCEFNISRVYAPVLQISPRLRWRTEISCRDLLGLVTTGNRAKALRALKKQLIRIQPVDRQEKLL